MTTNKEATEAWNTQRRPAQASDFEMQVRSDVEPSREITDHEINHWWTYAMMQNPEWRKSQLQQITKDFEGALNEVNPLDPNMSQYYRNWMEQNAYGINVINSMKALDIPITKDNVIKFINAKPDTSSQKRAAYQFKNMDLYYKWLQTMPLASLLGFGLINQNEDNKYADGTDGIDNEFDDASFDLKLSSKLMEWARRSQVGFNPNEKNIKTLRKDVAQNTYLLSRKAQEKEFLKQGYIKDNSGDYGLVKKAVGNRDIPIFQKNKDDITREEVIPIGNIYNRWFGEPDEALYHAGNYPTTIYADKKTGELYQKAFDLNDYGENTRVSSGARYPGVMQFFANALDKIGSPTVVTTGIQKIKNLDEIDEIYNVQDNIKLINFDKYEPIINMGEYRDFLNRRNILHTYTAGYVTPDVIITPKNKKNKNKSN